MFFQTYDSSQQQKQIDKLFLCGIKQIKTKKNLMRPGIQMQVGITTTTNNNTFFLFLTFLITENLIQKNLKRH